MLKKLHILLQYQAPESFFLGIGASEAQLFIS